MNVRIMISIGGWSDYSAIDLYLAEPTEQRFGQAMTVQHITSLLSLYKKAIFTNLTPSEAIIGAIKEIF
jgi:hypothetical protein